MTNDGGPAFPETRSEEMGEPGRISTVTIHHKGMSLRDWFAGQALAGLTVCLDVEDRIALNNGVIRGESLGKIAYVLADAMLEARTDKAEA